MDALENESAQSQSNDSQSKGSQSRVSDHSSLPDEESEADDEY